MTVPYMGGMTLKAPRHAHGHPDYYEIRITYLTLVDEQNQP